jgi:hypothetical protein
MVVEIVELPPAPGGGGLGASGARHGHRVASTTAAEGATSGGHEIGATGSSGNDLMKMRGGGGLSFGLSPEFIAKFLEASRPVPPKDTDAERIDDDIAHDRAALDDPDWVAHASPDEVRAMRKKLVADLDRRAHQELHPAGGGRFTSEHTSFGVDVAADGTIAFHRNSSGDLTDMAMRSQGIDPYAAEKLAWLDKTRDDRVAIGKRHEHEVLAHTPEYVERNVEWAWQRGRDLATRKQDLFDLWDECAESGSDDLIAAGTAARTYLIGFIRARLPVGSPDAYTAAELAELNAHRHSTQTFAPY